jgi:hypothetical protein
MTKPPGISIIANAVDLIHELIGGMDLLMVFHKNNPLVNGLTLDIAWPALLARVSSALIVHIINK